MSVNKKIHVITRASSQNTRDNVDKAGKRKTNSENRKWNV